MKEADPSLRTCLGLDFLYVDNAHSTGTVSVALANDGQPKFVLHRPAAYDFPHLTAEQLNRLFSRPVDWVYFGTLHQMGLQARQLTMDILARVPEARRFYDLNLRPDAYTPTLLQQLMSRATVIKLNHDEVEVIARLFGSRHSSLEDFCRNYAHLYGWEAVCVTHGSLGGSVLMDGQYIEAPGYSIQVVDTVGAGDAFAAAFLHGLGSGWPTAQIADFANRVGALVASRRGGIPDWTVAEANALQSSTTSGSGRLETA